MPRGSYMLVDMTLRGVFVSRTPADTNEGANSNEAVLVITVPDDVLADYWIAEEGLSVSEACAPASVLNRYPVRLATDEEVERAGM
jgi:hypothetical protein